MKKKSYNKKLIAESKKIQDKIEVLKIDYSIISYSNESASLKAVKVEINEFCQKYMPFEAISKDVVSHLLGALIYSNHPDKVGEIFNRIEDILYLKTKSEIDSIKFKKERKPFNYALIILGICIVMTAFIYAFLFRYEQTDRLYITFDRWTGEFLQK